MDISKNMKKCDVKMTKQGLRGKKNENLVWRSKKRQHM